MARTETILLQAERVLRRRAADPGGLGGLGGLARRLRALTGTNGEPNRALPQSYPQAAEATSSEARPGSIPPPEPSLPTSVLDGARHEVIALLAAIDEVRPGLVQHRALDLDCRTGARCQVLCESFDECDAMSASFELVRVARRMNSHGDRCRYMQADARQELPFEDETFDLVHCGTLPGGHAEHVIVETLRVLRLFGVAVVDVPADAAGPAPHSLDDPLEVRLSAPELFSPPGELEITVANTGGSTLGSVISPLRIEARWTGPDPLLEAADMIGTELPGSLLPGDSITATLPLAAPASPGRHVLQLIACSSSPWDERRCAAVTVGIGDERIEALVARAGGVILRTETPAPGAGAATRRRYLLARA